MKTRQDAWSHEEDVVLAETVLRYIREGGTQLAAFEEVGNRLNRTAAACGFRWNAEVRKRYVEAIELAKKERKERKRALEMAKKLQKENILPTSENISYQGSSPFLPASPLTLEQCIAFLQTLKHDYEQVEAIKKENERLKQEQVQLQKQREELQQKLERLEAQQSTIQEDYEVLVKIMERARKLVLEEEYGVPPAHIFRMDKNGNLEHIVRS
ncbi:RsfA family transcription factor [Parageobacillus genomosp. 1]|uniref:RsfA family transcription factor n=1 Tax=Parageobacillus genomosp. 1 TaxID=1295642 RepID=A0ABC9VD44_9BACL|nr:RsfA family transcriptional regulator [Parageobacillus genomosp. 1]EZP76274.1 RsfA family transcription factor [Parageobacillus genomosp. 1]